MKEYELNQARIFNIASQEMLPLIEDMRKTAYDKLLAEFRNGSKDLLTLVAQLAALQNLIDEIQTKQELFNHYATKGSEQ